MTMKQKRALPSVARSDYFPKATTVTKYTKTTKSTKKSIFARASVHTALVRMLRGFSDMHDQTERLLEEHVDIDRKALASLERMRILLDK